MDCPKCNKWPNQNWDQGITARALEENAKLRAALEKCEDFMRQMAFLGYNGPPTCPAIEYESRIAKWTSKEFETIFGKRP